MEEFSKGTDAEVRSPITPHILLLPQETRPSLASPGPQPFRIAKLSRPKVSLVGLKSIS